MVPNEEPMATAGISATPTSSVEPGVLDPAMFRQPKKRHPTCYLYLARCGRGCGDTPETLLAAFAMASPGVQTCGLHVGEAGVSYASFATPEAAENVRAG